jgi:uncharacterized membrane protein YbhN (UPF0104 family)
MFFVPFADTIKTGLRVARALFFLVLLLMPNIAQIYLCSKSGTKIFYLFFVKTLAVFSGKLSIVPGG